jgi:hypothetical protein
MNKSLLLAITMVLVLGGWANAQSSRYASYQGQSSGPITSQSTSNIIDSRGGVIYNITLNATGNNAIMTVYDANGLQNGVPEVGVNGEVIVYEVEVATSGNSSTVDFSTAPLNTYNGITVSVTNGVGYMNIQR